MHPKRPLTIQAALFMAAFIVFTLVTACVDRAPIGPDGVSTVGLAHLNQAVQRTLGRSQTAYLVSKLLGLLALATIPFYALAGGWQLIRRHSFKKVDRSLLLLGVYYLTILLFYLLFERLSINLRPVFEADGTTLEPSYPSTHALLGICLPGASCLILREWLRNAGRIAAMKLSALLHLLMGAGIVVGRLLAGVHWFTDIIGGVLLALSLLLGLAAALHERR